MKYTLIPKLNEAGLFKNSAQMKKQMEKDAEKSDDEIVANIANDAVINPLKQIFYKDASFNNAVIKATEALLMAAMASNSETDTRYISTPGYYGYYCPATNILNKIRLDEEDNSPKDKVVTSKEFNSLKKEVENKTSTFRESYWKNEDGVEKILSIYNKCQSQRVGVTIPDSETVDMLKSDKRAVFIWREMNDVENYWNFYTTYLFDDKPSPLNGEESYKFKFLVMLTGKDYDAAGLKKYEKVMQCYLDNNLTDPYLDEYYAQIYKEVIKPIEGKLIADLKIIKECAESYMVDLVNKKKKSSYDKKLIQDNIPKAHINIEIMFGRPAIGNTTSDTIAPASRFVSNKKYKYKGVIPLKNVPSIKI